MNDAHRTVRTVVLLWVLAALDEVAPHQDGIGGRLGRLAGGVRDRMLDVVGPDEIVERLDVNAVLDRVDVNALLDRVDPDRLLDRVDVNALLDRVDVNALLDRVDPDRLLDRVDVDALMDRVDVERVVQRAGIPDIVAESTTSVAGSALDMLRRQLLALDVVLTRGVMRVLGRDDASLPAGPASLAGDGGPTHSMPVPNAPVNDVTGHYAGAVTRLVAHTLDTTIAGAVFTIASGALLSALRTAGVAVEEFDRTGALFVGALATWVFVYWWASTAVAGRTPGMAVVGLRIVDRSGEPLSGRRAFVRVLVLPVSIALLGLGLLGIVFDRERRALHDAVAGSTVVYDWGDRRATMPTPLARWLAQHAAPIDPDP
ncbi:MAG TPA: RDD family protein [Euzebyales bacterium]|nr:RDD family protein [Euzebyales bacterium]